MNRPFFTIKFEECLMKKFTIIFIIGVVFSYSLRSQAPQWLNYTNGDFVNALTTEGIYMWIGTTGGLVKTNTVTGEPLFYNKSNSGLPDNFVLSIAIDAQGHKWFGTRYGGVAKFDNVSWTIYNFDNSMLPSNEVRSIAIDAQGNKWFGTGGGGVAKFDNTNWTVYNTSNSGIPGNYIRSIAIDYQNNKWFGTIGDGVAKFDDVNWTLYFTFNSGLPNNTVRTVAIDAQGNKWFGTWGGGIAKFDNVYWTVYNSSNSGLPNNYVFSIAIDGMENKWIGTWGGGVAKFDNNNWTVYNSTNSGLPNNVVNSTEIDSEGDKWFGTEGGGVAKFDDTNWIIYISSNSGISNNSIRSIAIDNFGFKWFGTENGGVEKFDNGCWTVYNGSNSNLPDYFVSSTAIDAEGNKWFGTYGGGVVKFDNVNWIVYNSYNSGLPSNFVSSITIDTLGNKWFGTDSGLAKFDNINWIVYNSTNSGLPNNSIRSIAIDTFGNKWIGTWDAGVAKFDDVNWVVYNNSNSGLPDDNVRSIAIDSQGNKWFGTDHGAAKFDNINWTVFNSVNSGLPNSVVNSIVMDNYGNKWFATGDSYGEGGVAKFDDYIWTVYNSSNSGLPSNWVFSLAIDPNENKWFGTFGGVGVFNEDGIFLEALTWFPIVIGQKMDFRHSDSTIITNTIWVDSAQNTGIDKIYYLNRIVSNIPGNTEYVLRDHPQFYSAHFSKQANGLWITTQFSLKPLNGLDSPSWIFDTLNNIQAAITEIDSEEIFGVVDSVKVIGLSTGQFIKLSKSFGIISFPDFESGGYYELVGLQDSLGESLPDFWDIYDFEVGDVFQYADYLVDPYGYGYITRKITITSKQINTNGYSYDYDGIYHIVYFEAGGGGGTDFYTYSDTFTFTDSLNHPANLYPGQLMLLPNSSSGIGTEHVYCRAKVVFDPEWNSVAKEFGLREFNNNPNSYDYDLFYELDQNSDTLYRFEQIGGMIDMPCGTKGLGFGNLLGNTFSNSGCFEFEADSILVGYIKDGDTVGIITPDSLLLTRIKNWNSAVGEIKIYPIPATDIVLIEGIEAGTMTIYNSMGNVVREFEISESSTKIDISKLPTGLYILQAITEEGIVAKKFIKE
jgi:ligand-binding sensor domain-containing protein